MKRRKRRGMVQAVVIENGKASVRLVDSSKICAPTKLLQEKLTPAQEASARYSWEHCGKYFRSSYEQWEVGFLTDSEIDRELKLWMVIATFCEKRVGESAENRMRYIQSFLSRINPAIAMQDLAKHCPQQFGQG